MTGPGNAKIFQLIFIWRGQLTVFVRDVYTRQRVCLHVLTMEALLIILPKHLLIEARQCRESEKELEDAAHNGKNHRNKSLMGPLKAWGPGEVSPVPLSVGLARQDHFGCDTIAQKKQVCNFGLS